MCDDYSARLFGPRIMDWRREDRRLKQDLYEESESLSRECVELLQRLEVHNQDSREIIISCLLARSIEFFQATVLLLSHGLLSPAQASARGLLEASFTAVAISKHDDVLRQYIQEDERHRLTLAQALRQSKNLGLRKLVTDELLSTLRDAVENEGIRKLSVEELSRKADLHDDYVVLYRMLSPPAHSKPRDLQRHFVMGPDELIESANFGPTDEATIPILASAALCLLNTLVSVETVFQMSLGDDHEKYKTYFEKLLVQGGTRARKK